MRKLSTVNFRQLCAIARAVLDQEPNMSDAEWKARTQDRLAQQGYCLQQPDMLTRVLNAVEHAHEKMHGTRQLPLPLSPGPPPPPPPPPLTRAEAMALFQQLIDGRREG